MRSNSDEFNPARERAARKKARKLQARQWDLREAAIQSKLEQTRKLSDIVKPYVPKKSEAQKDEFIHFYGEVLKRSKKFLSVAWGESLYALYRAAQYQTEYPTLGQWRPKSKGASSIFRQIAEHLLAKYPQPRIVWTMLEDSTNDLVPLVVHLASGGSLHKADSSLFRVPLTKKQCHAVLNTPKMTFMQAVRYHQTMGFGGSPQLAEAWYTHQQGREMGSVEDESFWATVLRFFARNPMLDLSQLGPIVDYIRAQRAENPSFSMSGRSALAILRAMERWHQTLYQAKVTGGISFTPSGFEGHTEIKSRRLPDGKTTEEQWAIQEIKSSKELIAEGRALRHCVYSYSASVQKGGISIWSLRQGFPGEQLERKVTIEVKNKIRQIAQVRGHSNRQMTPDEFRIINAWALKNEMTISSYL